MRARDDQPERVMVLAVLMPGDEPLCEAEAVPEAGPQDHAAKRLWGEMLTAVRRAVPEVSAMRAGWCAMRARGPARYYGDEGTAARAVLECLSGFELGENAAGPSIGVASGRFAAQQVARAREGDPHVTTASPGVHLVDARRTAAFLAPLPVTRAADEELIRG